LQYALVNSERREAFPGGRGQCPICSSPTIAKCGPRVIHHWAHTSHKDCDPWWENETEWHRAWKNLFPEQCREISYTAPDGEIHRADVVTQTGIVIEFQHSAMTDSERLARETFYQNLIWIVDGRGFRKNFDICHLLPHPQSELARDIRWFKATRQMRGEARGAFWRPSENPGHKTGDLVLYHSASEIEAEVSNAYRGHHQYDWIRPRRTWLDATCPVYVDLGDDLLAKLEIYDESGLPCIYLVAKQKLIHDAMTEKAATAIATRFYPLPPSGSPRG
jgi:competence protein CoiA